jgi:hypothetical protein
MMVPGDPASGIVESKGSLRDLTRARLARPFAYAALAVCLCAAMWVPEKARAGNLYAAVTPSPFRQGQDPVVDVTPPLTTVSVSPVGPNGDSGWFKGAAPLVTITTEDGGGSGKVTVFYDWGVSPPGSVYASTQPAPLGETVLFYRSVDSAGNTEPLSSLVFKVDTGTPAPLVTTPMGEETAPTPVNGTVSFEAGASDGISGVSYVAFYYFARKDFGWDPVGTQIELEQAPPPGAETASGVVYAVSWNTLLVPDGVYKLQAQVRDIAGNTTFSAPQYVRVDNWVERPGGGEQSEG